MVDATMAADWPDAVLRFWFEELTEAAWFKKEATVDATITARFAGLHTTLTVQVPDIAKREARPALAAVIVLDQFSRNMFRGTPRAFANDQAALTVAQCAVAQGFDQQLTPKQRWFLYLPYEHSEDRAVQMASIALFERLGDAEALKYAQQHKVIVDRFGRYPHRNAILGRASTAEELAFLQEPGSSF